MVVTSLYEWWAQGLTRPRTALAQWCSHVYREANKRADRIATPGVQGLVAGRVSKALERFASAAVAYRTFTDGGLRDARAGTGWTIHCATMEAVPDTWHAAGFAITSGGGGCADSARTSMDEGGNSILSELRAKVSSAAAATMTVVNSELSSQDTESMLLEVCRAGIVSVEKGLVEAASALAMTPFQRMRRVILPIAVKRMIPAFFERGVNLA